MGKQQTFKGRNVRGAASSDEGLKQRQADSERAQREAEEGTGKEQPKGYAGSGDSGADNGNRNLDPSQATRDQQQNQEAGKPLDADPAAGETKTE